MTLCGVLTALIPLTVVGAVVVLFIIHQWLTFWNEG